ncbi:MAG: pantoate--beta-alanine ligase [Candidatus Eisenbacteria bacterium]|nr:pantoate--beta-alanine ligase [Candidatus Eisenbacteria bacterium]
MSRTLRVARTRRELEALIGGLRREGPIGFVPTMGALHEGHLSLVRASVAECARTVASIFVNPAQFGPGEDLAAYPRPWEEDRALLEAEGTDILFLPASEEIYPAGPRAFIEVEDLSGLLCGAFRPGHFRGVATVVWKLLQIVDPAFAYFGAKDAQQAVIVRRMVAGLFGRWTIRVLPTVREKDGLAMSSRNRYLDPSERGAAPVLFRALVEGKRVLERGERLAGMAVRAASETLSQEPLVRPEYVALVSLADLRPVEEARGDLLFAIAARVGKARLIDNLALRVGERVLEILP